MKKNMIVLTGAIVMMVAVLVPAQVPGDNDQLVPLGQSVILAKALIDAGVEVTMKTIPGAGHEGPQFRTPESRRLMGEFLSRTIKK